jgi:WD40 repeat protein
MRTRLVAGIHARVVPGLPNSLRAEPNSTSALLSQIAGGSIFDVLAGPQCGEGLLWWQIDVDGQKGWTVEGRDETYWIEPLLPAALPATRTPISASNADGLSEIARLEGNFDGELAFSPDGATLAVLGAAGSDGVWLYKMASLQDPPRILPGDTLLTSLTFRPDGSQVLVGGSDGAVRLWNTGINETRVEALMLQTHASDIGAVAFAPSGAQFASVGTNALTTAQVDKSNAILLWDANNVSQQAALAGHTARVNALVYSRDGSRLISAGADKTLRIWDVTAKNALTTIQSQSPIRAAAYSPNGQFIAYGAEDGTVALLNAANGQTLSTLRGHTAAVNAVAFSPDNSLLVSVGDDGLVVVWSTQSDKALAILQGHTDKVTGVAFLPDGTLIASIGKDHTVRLWGVQQSVG